MKPSDLRKGTILGEGRMLDVKPAREARVCVLVPSRGTWTSHTGVSVSSLVSTSCLMGMGVMLIDEANSVITQARNKLARLALENDADYALWVDADMKFPADGLYRLLSHQKDLCCAFYNSRVPPYRTLGHLVGDKHEITGGLHEADLAGMGFMLTKMDVFKKLEPPWFIESYDPERKTKDNPDGLVGEDTNFVRKARAAGFKLWADIDLTFEMGHVGANVIPCLKPPPDLQKSPAPAITPT